MVELTRNAEQTPSEAVKAQMADAVVVTDKLGRKISLKNPGVLFQYKIMEVLGPERSANATLVQMCMPITFVTDIGGEPVFFPKTYAQLEATIVRLGDEGVATVMKAVQETWGASPEEDENAIKK